MIRKILWSLNIVALIVVVTMLYNRYHHYTIASIGKHAVRIADALNEYERINGKPPETLEALNRKSLTEYNGIKFKYNYTERQFILSIAIYDDNKDQNEIKSKLKGAGYNGELDAATISPEETYQFNFLRIMKAEPNHAVQGTAPERADPDR